MQIALIEPIANSTRAITGLRQDRGERKLARRRATRVAAQGSGCACGTPFVNGLNGFSRRSRGATLLGWAGFAMLRPAKVQKEPPMRRIAVLAIGLCTLAIGSRDAHAGAWCAYYDVYTSNCGFRTLEQCRATVSGDSRAYCAPNPYGASEQPRPQPRRRQ